GSPDESARNDTVRTSLTPVSLTKREARDTKKLDVGRMDCANHASKSTASGSARIPFEIWRWYGCPWAVGDDPTRPATATAARRVASGNRPRTPQSTGRRPEKGSRTVIRQERRPGESP